jgi:hypothetical protein
MAIFNTSVTSTNGPLSSGSGDRAITTLIFCNTSLYDAETPTAKLSKLYVYAVPSGGTAGNGNIIVNGLPIPAGETVSFDQEKMVLGTGDSLVAKATNIESIDNITATVSILVV